MLFSVIFIKSPKAIGVDVFVESLQVKLRPSIRLTFFLTERMQNLVRYQKTKSTKTTAKLIITTYIAF